MRGRRHHGLTTRVPGAFGPEVACVVAADLLFWGHDLGLSVPLFGLVVAMAAWSMQVRHVPWQRRLAAATVLALALVPAVDRLTPLSLAFAVCGTAVAVRLGTTSGAAHWVDELGASLRLLLVGPTQAIQDLRRRRDLGRRRAAARSGSPGKPGWMSWVVPVVIFAPFLALLVSANPLMSSLVVVSQFEFPFP